MVSSGVLRRLMLLAALAAGLFALRAAAEPSGEPYGQELKETLHSKVLNEDRPIQVFLPTGYDPAKKRYDVVYVLDGEMLARFVPPVRAFAEENELMPPVIIVGVPNLYWYDKGQDSRERDLLPAHVAGSPLSGGAEAFTRFLGSELIPFVDGKYATSGRRLLFGHSYAGMFTVYTFLQHPELFDGYIASDPALWWNGGYVDRLAAERLPKMPKLKRTLFVGARSGRMSEAFGVDRFTALLRTEAPPTLRWKRVINADEDHGSVRLKNIYDGLKFSYFGASPSMIDFFPRDGILLKGQPVRLMNYSSFLQETPGIRYTTDGSEPTPRSPRFDWGVSVTAPSQVTLKQFSNFGPDRTAKGSFRLGRALAPETPPANWRAGGLGYVCRAGADFEAGPAPLATGRTDGALDIGRIGGGAPFICRIDGAFRAERDGYYVFFLDADGPASLYLGGRRLIGIDPAKDNGGRSFVLALRRGLHTIRLDYAHQGGDRRLDLTYLPLRDGQALARLPIPIPPELQYGP